MKLLICCLCLPVLYGGLASWPLDMRAATPTVATLVRLGGDPDGYHPQGGLMDGGDGFFYGTSEAGGPANLGTIYKVAPDGTLTTIYLFTDGDDGANPQTALVSGGDGNFYGTTLGEFPYGSNPGTVFRVTPAGVLTTIYRFSVFDASLRNNEGGYPSAALTRGSDGNLYGTTYGGGATGQGTVFRVTLAGALTKLADFNFLYSADPTVVLPALTEGSDGNFYGVSPYGDPNGNVGNGLIFRVTPGGTLTPVYRFTGGADGASPVGSLTRGSDGNFYGATQSGGAAGNGTVYKATLDGTLTTLHDFVPAEGQYPGTLTLGADGNFYGTTNRSGPSGYGTVFCVTAGGTLTVLASFQSEGAPGIGVSGLLPGSDGNFYGTTQHAGNGDAGTVFRVTPTGAFTALHLFHAGGSKCQAALAQFPNGAFYGVTRAGGKTNDGTMFEATMDGGVRTIHDFDSDTDGGSPIAGLVPDGTGAYFGTCALGGPDGGGVFYEAIFTFGDATSSAAARSDDGKVKAVRIPSSIIPDTSVVTRALNPNVTTTGAGEILSNVVFVGSPPAGSGVPPGTIYTTAEQNGDFGSGGILMYPPGGPLSYVYQFGSQTGDGLFPHGIVAGADGNVYGVTSGGGAAGLGTVFRYAPGGTVTVLHSFAGTGDGAEPLGGLALGQDGNLYGTTSIGSVDPTTQTASGNGTIFQITPDGAFTTIHTLASDGSDGSDPQAPLLQASDGNFYGTTTGGTDSDGTVFSITSAGTFTTLHSFNFGNGDGQLPAAALIQGSDGNFYGTTEQGGTDDNGTIYRVTLNPATVATVPVVTLTAAVPQITVDGGQSGEFLLTLSSAPTADIKVAYTIKGSATPGVDYVALKGTAKVKAGKTSKIIKVTPEGTLNGADKKVVKLTLAPGTGYTVGTTTFMKVKILPPAQ